MPFLPFDDDQKKKAAEQNSTNISGASNTVNQTAQSVSAPKPVQNSGSWTNLNSYLDANKDQAMDMGNTISGKISDTGSQVRTGIQNTTDDFNAQADKGTIANLGGAKQDSDNIIKQARTNGYDGQINDGQTNRFKEVANAAYKGPQDLTAAQPFLETQTKLNKAKDYQTNAQTDEGRFGILQEMFNRPTYSQGQKSLDNLLIQGNDTAKTNIKSAADALNDLQGSWDKAATDAQSLATQRTTDSNLAKQYAQDALLTNRNARTSEVDTDLADKQSHWADQYNHYNDLLSGYKGGNFELTRDEANALALKESGQGIYNTLNGHSPSEYLDLKDYDQNKVIGKDQYAQLSALDKLANQFGSVSTSKFNDPTQAGTLGLNNNFDASRFGTAADQGETSFNNYAANTSVNGHGQDTQTYYDGLGGMNKHETSAGTDLSANLANLLNNGAISVDGVATNNPAGGIRWNNTNQQTGNPIGDVVSGAANGVGNALFNWDWSGASKASDAGNTAKIWANQQAQGNFMNQLNDLLNQQGYSNRVKIKE